MARGGRLLIVRGDSGSKSFHLVVERLCTTTTHRWTPAWTVQMRWEDGLRSASLWSLARGDENNATESTMDFMIEFLSRLWTRRLSSTF